MSSTLNSDTSESELHFKSSDLTEATYSLNGDIVSINIDILLSIFEDNPIVKVFGDLIRVTEREIELSDLKDQGLLKEFPDTIISKRGSFMGDPLSFAILTVHNSICSTYATMKAYGYSLDSYIKRPLHTITGDDLLAIKVKRKYCDSYDDIIRRTGGTISKIDSCSTRVGTYCEQSFVSLNQEEVKDYASNPSYTDSLFKDILFLDIIKGSLLSRQAKVKMDGSDPFIGHSKMAAKQVSWHPLGYVKRRVPLILWAVNFNQARRLANAHAYLPPVLGGLGIALGRVFNPNLSLPENQDLVQYYLSYLGSIADPSKTDYVTAIEVLTMLSNITTGSNKGLKFENNLEKIVEIFDKSKLKRLDSADLELPTYLKGEDTPWYKRQAYIREKYHLLSIREINSLLNTCKSIQEVWNSPSFKPPPILRNTTKGLRERFRNAWAQIRNRFTPVPTEEIKLFKTLNKFVKKIEDRSWEMAIDVDSPILREVCGGITEFHVQLN
jgi:hypothetical protein